MLDNPKTYLRAGCCSVRHEGPPHKSHFYPHDHAMYIGHAAQHNKVKASPYPNMPQPSALSWQTSHDTATWHTRDIYQVTAPLRNVKCGPFLLGPPRHHAVKCIITKKRLIAWHIRIACTSRVSNTSCAIRAAHVDSAVGTRAAAFQCFENDATISIWFDRIEHDGSRRVDGGSDHYATSKQSRQPCIQRTESDCKMRKDIVKTRSESESEKDRQNTCHLYSPGCESCIFITVITAIRYDEHNEDLRLVTYNSNLLLLLYTLRR